MFKLLARIFKPLPPLEAFASSGWSSACSPDDIIVASLLESVAKEPELWGNWDSDPTNYDFVGTGRIATNEDLENSRLRWRDVAGGGTCELRRKGSDPIILKSNNSWRRAAKDYDDCGPWIYKPMPSAGRLRIGEVELSEPASKRFLTAFAKIKADTAAAKEAADKALAAMQETEKKWNMAESMLGMKRNEFGALVPVTTGEG